MRIMRRGLSAFALFFLCAFDVCGIGQELRMETVFSKGCFVISQDGRPAAIAVDAKDHAGVIRAAGDLRDDVQRVTGKAPILKTDATAPAAETVIVGTVGKSGLIDALEKAGKIDVGRIRGKWESYLIQVIPLGGSNALVVAGSDKRGTIYGIYGLSEAMGVSPWYWWADVPVRRRNALFMKPQTVIMGPPSVKYRGIFLNDEAPDLTNWIQAKYGEVRQGMDPPIPGGVANYGREFYTRLFELILRLKGNYLWPAMWNNAFNEDDPENPRLADEYGVVMGNSHQEPMLRAQKEWDRRYKDTLGYWNYGKHADVLEKFWREGIRRNREWESIVTIGLRGADDTPMAPGGPEANMRLLEKIVDVQRGIISQEMKTEAKNVPQLWCLYKEVQDFYKAGMRVPDDVTLLWAEDNWGNVRRLPTPAERMRSGGAGIYYHFDYHGGPRSYQWLNTSPIPKIWDQMSLSRQYGADRIWIVNVGHFKGYELPLEYFMSLAWDAEKWTNGNLNEFTRLWAEREFGPEYAADIADIVSKYSKYNSRRKPELLSPDTYSLVNYREAERVVEDYDAVAARAEKIHGRLPADARDAFYQLVLFPAKACAVVNALYVAAGKNALYARQGRASAPDMAREVRGLFKTDTDMMRRFNTDFAGGKWAHFMDQAHLGYVSWRDPPSNSLDAIPLVENEPPSAAAMGVAVEGSDRAWPGGTGSPALPGFDSLNAQKRYIEVFNRGRTPFEASFSADAPWICMSEKTASIGPDRRLWVEVDWSRLPPGTATGAVKIRGAGVEVSVALKAFKPAEPARETLCGFVQGDGYVAMEAEHFERNVAAGANGWIRIEDYGHTLSGMRTAGPVDAPPAAPGKDSPCLEYVMYLFDSGSVAVTTVLSPTLNFQDGRPLRYAVSFDDQAPVTVTAVPADFSAQNGNGDWERTVMDNARFTRTAHSIAKPGYHTLKVWMVDPGLIVQRLVVDLGGVRPSYLGPPESFRGSAK